MAIRLLPIRLARAPILGPLPRILASNARMQWAPHFALRAPVRFFSNCDTKKGVMPHVTFPHQHGDHSMHKTRKYTAALLGLGVALSTLGLFAQENEMTAVTPITLSKVEGREWVRSCVDRYPEILWLADAQVRKTEEGQATAKGPYSEQLFGQKFVEFDRTIMTLQCLKWILDGSDQSYEAFTAAQPKEQRLSRESFRALHYQGQTILGSRCNGLSEQQLRQAMETALVLGDMGKSEKARALLKPYGATAPDQDDFYGEAMHIVSKNPQLCPSFARLPEGAKQLVVGIANLAHYGHVTHLEGGIDMFSKLRESGIPVQNPIALSFDLFVHICDVAGALGHSNHLSSIVYTELTHRALQATGAAAKVLSQPDKTEWDAYNTYLGLRASWLGIGSEDRSERVLARIGAMLRLFTPEEGAVIKKALLQLDETQRNRIAVQLDAQKTAQPGRTPTYMPAVLVNLANNPALGATKEERLAKAVTIGLPFLARVLESHREMLATGKADSNIPLNFNEIARVAKEAPNTLNDQCVFAIDKQGKVVLIAK